MKITLTLLLLLGCLILGLLLTELSTFVKLEGRLVTGIPINLLVFVTLGISIGMILGTIRNDSYPKKTKFLLLGTILAYSIILYHFSSETASAVNFNFSALVALTFFVCFFAATLLMFERNPFKFSMISPERDFVFFVSSVMWLSPLICELFILLRWDLQGVFSDKMRVFVLGGNGFSDVLIFFGFWAFLTSVLFGIGYRLLIRNIR